MLSRENRINKDKDFDRVFKTGQSFYNQIFGLKKAKNDLDISRFGILINTKVSKKATVRNKLRRQIREIIKENLESIKPGYDLVIIVLPLMLEKNFQEIKTALLAGLKKVEAI